MQNKIKNVLEEYEIDLKYNVLLSPIIENSEQYKNRVNYIRFYKTIEKEGVSLKEP